MSRHAIVLPFFKDHANSHLVILPASYKIRFIGKNKEDHWLVELVIDWSTNHRSEEFAPGLALSVLHQIAN
jgi:hypothetical protein